MGIDEIKIGELYEVTCLTEWQGMIGICTGIHTTEEDGVDDPFITLRFQDKEGGEYEFLDIDPDNVDWTNMFDPDDNCFTLSDQFIWTQDMFAECYGGLVAEEELDRLYNAAEIKAALRFILKAERMGQQLIEEIVEEFPMSDG